MRRSTTGGRAFRRNTVLPRRGERSGQQRSSCDLLASSGRSRRPAPNSSNCRNFSTACGSIDVTSSAGRVASRQAARGCSALPRRLGSSARSSHRSMTRPRRARSTTTRRLLSPPIPTSRPSACPDDRSRREASRHPAAPARATPLGAVWRQHPPNATARDRKVVDEAERHVRPPRRSPRSCASPRMNASSVRNPQ